eukprot:Tbor_TRINITY_DN5805_c3_g6::TRINITY_DN5805_c3_g6_i1::g.6755::m.6755
MSAEVFKQEGNYSFIGKQFDEALRNYSKAIDLDPSNHVLYNNRAAAYYELKQYDASLRDAKKALELQSNAKSYSRMGAAYWAMGELDLALQQYEAGYRLQADSVTKGNIDKLKQIMDAPTASRPRTSDNTGAPHVPDTVGCCLDAAIVLCAFLQFISSFLMPWVSVMLWKYILTLMTLRCLQLLWKADSLKPTMECLKKLPSSFGGQYLIVCVIMLFISGNTPQLTLISAIAIYCLVDLSYSQRPIVDSMIPQQLLHRAKTQLDTICANRVSLLVSAATFEIMTCIFAPFFGGGLMVSLIMGKLLIRRYSSDQATQMAFRQMSDMTGRIFYDRRCPSILASVYTKIKNHLHKLATS